MKNELLARAISEIDDDLIEEAYLPVNRKKSILYTVSKYALAAACLIIVAAAALSQLGSSFGISINGTDMLSEAVLELPLISTAQQRMYTGMELPLHISVGKSPVTVSPGDGSIICDTDGNELKALTFTCDTDIIWITDTSSQRSFLLTLSSNDKSVRITANISDDNNSLAVSAYCD